MANLRILIVVVSLLVGEYCIGGDAPPPSDTQSAPVQSPFSWGSLIGQWNGCIRFADSISSQDADRYRMDIDFLLLSGCSESFWNKLNATRRIDKLLWSCEMTSIDPQNDYSAIALIVSRDTVWYVTWCTLDEVSRQFRSWQFGDCDHIDYNEVSRAEAKDFLNCIEMNYSVSTLTNLIVREPPHGTALITAGVGKITEFFVVTGISPWTFRAYDFQADRYRFIELDGLCWFLDTLLDEKQVLGDSTIYVRPSNWSELVRPRPESTPQIQLRQK